MASVEHCLVCFEALDADLSSREPLSLQQVQASWAAYRNSSSPDVVASHAAPIKDPALRRITTAAAAADSGSSSSSTPSSASSTSLLTAAAAAASSSSSLPADIASAPGPASAPLFVTWNTVSASDGDTALRGCIGTFEAQPLARGLPEYALISALQDSRFPPVSRRELPALQAAVTLLTDFEGVDDAYDWDIGTHGIRLSFSDRGRRYGATYLPDVALEQEWTKEETLFSLVRKAGWMGSRSRWRDLDLKVTRYQGKKVSLDYPEFEKWRDWVSST